MRVANIEKTDHAIAEAYAAAIADYKINEFVRLDLPGLMPIAAAGPFLAPGGPPAPQGAPANWWEILKAIENWVDWEKEVDKIKGKIQNILDALQPPPGNGNGEVVIPPKPPTPGTTRLRQILEVLEAVKEAAENLEPDSARDNLKEAKGMMHDEAVKAEFLKLKAGKSWYDILKEMQDAIKFLDCVAKPE